MAKGFSRPAAGGAGGMMQQMQRLQQELAEAQAKLAGETVTATTGGGAIKVTMNGDQKCKSVEISAGLLQEPDVEMLQDLIMSAVNLALDQSRDLASQRLALLTDGAPFQQRMI